MTVPTPLGAESRPNPLKAGPPGPGLPIRSLRPAPRGAKRLPSGRCSAVGRHVAHLGAILHVLGRVPGEHCALISDRLPISRAVKAPLLIGQEGGEAAENVEGLRD